MPKAADRDTKLAYVILDYIAHCTDKDIDMTSKRTVNSVAKIIREFDGRATVELKHLHPHSGFLRGIKGD